MLFNIFIASKETSVVQLIKDLSKIASFFTITFAIMTLEYNCFVNICSAFILIFLVIFS